MKNKNLKVKLIYIFAIFFGVFIISSSLVILNSKSSHSENTENSGNQIEGLDSTNTDMVKIRTPTLVPEPVVTPKSIIVGIDQKKDVPKENTKLNSEKELLKGIIVGVDPGHQEKANNELEEIAPNSSIKKTKVSSGTQGTFTKVKEYELNLDVGLLLKEELISLGATVIMTREENDVNISNSERVKLTNENKCDIVIRFHANGSNDQKDNGYSILVPGKKFSSNIVEKSTQFALILDDLLKKKGSTRSGGIVTRDDLTRFNWSKTPVVLLEMGYMTNKFDDEVMETSEFKKEVVLSIAEAIDLYMRQ